MIDRHEYTVCFLFSHDLARVLLARKNTTEFAGKLNGVGGELENDEPPYRCADREILEETGVSPDQCRSLGLVRSVGLGTLTLPRDCKYGTGTSVLHYFAAALKPGVEPFEKTDRGEELVWEPVENILSASVRSERYAGDGDLAYFVNMGLKELSRYLPGHAQEGAADA